MSDGFVGLFLYTGAPNPPSSLVLTDKISSIEITFDTSDTNGVSKYEIWRSESGDIQDNYKLLAEFSTSEYLEGSSITYKDLAPLMSRKGTKYYKIYSIMDGVLSTPLSGNISFPYDVDEVTNVAIESSADTIILKFNLPNDNRLEKVEIFWDNKSNSSDLSFFNSILVFSGITSVYTHKIPYSSRSGWNQFWIKTITREDTVSDDIMIKDVVTVVRESNINVFDPVVEREGITSIKESFINTYDPVVERESVSRA